MLKQFFIVSKIHSKVNNIVVNKNILKRINYFIYNVIFLVYRLLTIFVYPFQRMFINLYTVELQLNRLPFRIIPNSFKFILIYFVDFFSWILFFKRIKNNVNLYIIREKRYRYLHRLWCVFFRNESIYYPELNINRVKSNEISNFFNQTRIWNKTTNKVSSRRHKFILFYYINKIVVHKYPYFYWTYIFAYDMYGRNSKATNKSQHIRTQILFFFVNSLFFFTKNKSAKSFNKFDTSTFNGIKKTIKIITKVKTKKFILKTKKFKDKILTKPDDKILIFYKNSIKVYNNIYKLKKPIHKFYINSIIYNYGIKIKKTTEIFFQNINSTFKLQWYNKVHNSTSNSIKYNIIFYLRAAKHFNKGRYSRNRQLYRTGVYWCIWLNIIIVYSLHFYFYRVVYSFGYLWIPFSLMMLVMFSSRFYKYRFYNIYQLFKEFKEFSSFIFFIFLKLKHIVIKKLKNKVIFFIKFLTNYLFLLYIFISLKLSSIVSFFRRMLTL